MPKRSRSVSDLDYFGPSTAHGLQFSRRTQAELEKPTDIELMARPETFPGKTHYGYEFFSSVPVVLLTTESHLEKKQEGKAVGATAWIVKQFNPDQLLAVVKKVIT